MFTYSPTNQDPSSTDFITFAHDVPSSVGPLSLSLCISILSIMSYTRVAYRFSLLHGRHSFQPLSCHEIFNILGIQLSKAAVFIHRRGFHPLPPGNNGSRSITDRTSSFRRRRRRRRMKRDEFFQPTLTNLTNSKTYVPPSRLFSSILFRYEASTINFENRIRFRLISFIRLFRHLFLSKRINSRKIERARYAIYTQ